MSAFWQIQALDSALAGAEQFDGEGFLRQPSDWTPALGEAIAACIPAMSALSAEHLAVLNAARDFYQRYQRMPTTRVFVKYLSTEVPSVANSLALMRLFPDTPMRWVAICAGLPKPPNCF